MLRDIRYACRALLRNRGFASAAILSIGLAIGANAAIFSLADGMILRPLPVPEPSEVVTLSTIQSRAMGRPTPFGGVSYPEYVEFRDANRSFEQLTAYKTVTVGFAKDTNTQPQLRTGLAVAPNFFDTIRVTPKLGRGFRSDEGRTPGRDPIIVLSHELWQSEFGGSPDVVGRRVRLNETDLEIVGVAPESFTGLSLPLRPAFYVLATMEPTVDVSKNSGLLTDRQQRRYDAKGRLRPGVSPEAAGIEAASIFSAFLKSYPDSNLGIEGTVQTEFQARVGREPITPYVIALLGLLVAIVLAIACGNVANLILGRARSQVREAAIRLAIGASRRRLVWQLMMESVVIALFGGAFGVAIAAAAVRLFPKIDPPGDIPAVMVIQLDERVLWFTLAASIVSALLCGLVPAILSARTDILFALRSAGSDRRRRLFGRSTLVSIQIAGSLVLLIAGIQLSRGFTTVLGTEPGYRTDHRLTMRMDPSLAGYDSARTDRFYKTLIERVKETRGVSSAALSSWIPMADGWRSISAVPEGFQFPAGQDTASVLVNTVDANYFDTLSVPLLKGRGFEETDRADSPLVAVVNEGLARKYFGGEPIGKRLRLVGLGDRTAEIVGMTPTGKNISAIEPPIDFVYVPFSQHPQVRMTLTVKTLSEPADMAAPMRELIQTIAPSVPVFNVRTFQDVYEQRSVKIANLIRGIVAFVGVLGLTLALVGLYAIVAYQVSRRTREIGIRMAIGAGRPDVMRMILKQASTMAVCGVVLGLIGGIAIAPMLTIIGNGPAYDSTLFSLAPIALLLTTLLAAAIPARRASRIEPQKALRQD